MNIWYKVTGQRIEEVEVLKETLNFITIYIDWFGKNIERRVHKRSSHYNYFQNEVEAIGHIQRNASYALRGAKALLDRAQAEYDRVCYPSKIDVKRIIPKESDE